MISTTHRRISKKRAKVLSKKDHANVYYERETNQWYWTLIPSITTKTHINKDSWSMLVTERISTKELSKQIRHEQINYPERRVEITAIDYTMPR